MKLCSIYYVYLPHCAYRLHLCCVAFACFGALCVQYFFAALLSLTLHSRVATLKCCQHL